MGMEYDLPQFGPQVIMSVHITTKIDKLINA